MRRGQEIEYARAAGGLAEHRDVVPIAAERRDIALDPGEGSELIEQAVVSAGLVRPALGRQRRVREIPEKAEPVIEADEHDALPCERRAVVERQRSRTEAMCTA